MISVKRSTTLYQSFFDIRKPVLLGKSPIAMHFNKAIHFLLHFLNNTYIQIDFSSRRNSPVHKLSIFYNTTQTKANK